MSESWFFLATVPRMGDRAMLDERESRHAAGARRLRAGETITVFDGKGTTASATILRAGRTIEIELGESTQHDPLVPAIHLVAALPKGDRQSVMLSMAAQLGIASFTPLLCARSVARPGRGFEERAERIMLEACKQSRNPHLPTIGKPTDIHSIISAPDRAGTILLAQPDGEPLALAVNQLAGIDRVLVLIGPEGGFTPEEIALDESANAHTISLGQTILRTETAAIAAVSFVRLATGKVM
jgi:16S rRNA (uracil1498-N3)-methyltransferase